MRIALDSNILVYASDRDTPDKRRIASEIMRRAIERDTVLPAQVLAEYLAVFRRKYPDLLPEAARQARIWAALFPIASTGVEQILDAADLAIRHRFQFWDAVIWKVAAAAGARWFLSEDLQDGFTLNGLTALNPFAAANDAALAAILAG